jgi:hypothetical protein
MSLATLVSNVPVLKRPISDLVLSSLIFFQSHTLSFRLFEIIV